MGITLRHLVESDLPLVHHIRNHPDTLPFLHDQRSFSITDTIAWYHASNPKWLAIENDQTAVGYVRMSDHDVRNRNVKIGIDIHPQHRRQGFATAAYRLLFEQLIVEGWNRVWLEVLPSNTNAIELYKRLGFQHEGRLNSVVKRGNTYHDSLVMGKILCPITNKNVKVIVSYLGPRRFLPTNSRDYYHLLGYMLEQELTVNPGCQCDTVIIHNRDDGEFTDHWMKQSEELLNKVDGSVTPGGYLRVIKRQNIGISFGAYNYTFETFFKDYDHWFFIEDDQVIVKPGSYAKAIDQIRTDINTGFVAMVGVSTDKQFITHAHGGVGVSSRSILREVRRANICERHPNGHLPYHYAVGYTDQEQLGEIRFTNAIYKLGYNLVNHTWNEICVSWGVVDRRTPRMLPWNKAMEMSHRFC